eukprot:3506398-Rhodomonas_salina.1
MDRGAHEFGERPAQQHESLQVLMDLAAYEFGEHQVRRAYEFGECPAHVSESQGSGSIQVRGASSTRVRV